jgi:transposase
MQEVCIGIDVSKDTLEVCVGEGIDRWTSPNDDDGIAAMVKGVKKHTPVLVVLEATGGLEMRAAASLYAKGVPVAVVNPQWVRNFAKGFGILAKTDAIDARVLALYAEKVRPECRPVLSKDERKLKELLMRRMQLIGMRTAEQNRLGQIESLRVRTSIKKLITIINRELAQIEDDLELYIRNSPIWCEKDAIIQSVPGVGPGTSHMLLACMPELGTLDRQEIACLAGLAPMNNDSGRFRGKRTTRGGRRVVRAALHMPTLCATIHNPIIRTYYQRLITAGKSKNLALTACKRKLLTIINTMVANQSLWCTSAS